jgi:microcystin-dependent protein
MASFRDGGLELNIKNMDDLTAPTGDRFTIFAVNSVSPSARAYAMDTGESLWMVDMTGGLHEISNDWLESKVGETSAKLDHIYPAVTEFMSAGLLFLNSTTVQTISSDLEVIGNSAITGNSEFVKGSVTFGQECPAYVNGGLSAFSDICAYEHLSINRMGTVDTMDNITPFFIRSSANRLHPEGWSDPAILVIGNTKVYDMFKPEDRGLRFTVLNRETLQVIHDEVYDTAGSQYRVTDLAWKMFALMNNTKHVGILNSREDWESLIWRKQTVESVGLSATDISAAYWNIQVGSLLDQFERFGLLKAIRASGKHAEMYPNQAGSQYCAVFEGSDILVSGGSSTIYPTNRAIESWVPRVSNSLPVHGEQQRAQIVGWFAQPRQLDITNNIADRSAAFVATAYGRENDAIRETVYVNKNGLPAEFNARVSNTDVDVLKTTFSSPEGLWYLIGDVRIEADLVDITGYATTYLANTLDVTGINTTFVSDTLDVTGLATRVMSNTLDVTGLATRVMSNTLDVTGLATRVMSDTLDVTGLNTRLVTNTANITALNSSIVANTIDITSGATTLRGSTLDITAETRHVGQINMTRNKIVELEYANIDNPYDAVNVEFTRVVLPIGGIIDYVGDGAPVNFLACDGALLPIDQVGAADYWRLYNMAKLYHGFGTSVTLSGNPYLLSAARINVTSISGVQFYVTNPIVDISGVAHTFNGIITGSFPNYTFASGSVQMVSGNPTFVNDGAISSPINYYALPNTNGRATIGTGTTTVLDVTGGSVTYTYGIGDVGGADKHMLTVAELAAHNHYFTTYQDDYAQLSTGQTPPGFGRDASVAGATNWIVSNTGDNKYHNNMQPYVALPKIIRYK